jgi:hypothetical protein
VNEIGTSTHVVQDALDREVRLVQDSIDLVASGGAVSTTVIGLRLADLVIEIVGPAASSRGVLVEPLWGADEAITDVRVRRMDRS